MKSRMKSPLPIDIPLPEGVLLDDASMFVRLRTLAELEEFWRLHQDKFHFAARGIRYGDEQSFLNENEWVFATTKAALVKTVCRWDQVGIRCEFYDWSKDDPAEWRSFFTDRDAYRAHRLEGGSWSEEEETTYQADSQRRSPQTYRGWWQLVNLPSSFPNDSSWFSPFADCEIIDPELPVEIVEKALQEFTFDDWSSIQSEGDIEFMDRDGVNNHIAYEKDEERRMD